MLSFRAAAALCLAGVLVLSHWAAFIGGSDRTQARWDRESAVLAKAVAEAQGRARSREQDMANQVVDVTKKVRNEQKLRALDAQSAAGELQLLQAALDHRGAASDACAASRADGATSGGLLLACAGEHQAMAAEADAVAVNFIGLQSYVAQVCKP